jgi:Zn-dependent protease
VSQLLFPTIHLRERTLELPIPWLVFFALLSLFTGWDIAALVFDDPAPTVRFIASFACLFVLAGSLAVHESGHILADRNQHWFSRHLTLHINGTSPASYFLPSTPGAEIRYSIAGPLTSLLAGAVSLGVANVAGNESALWTILVLTGGLNLALATANLIPSMPFDGGRILRAVFWYLNDNHLSGTRVAFVYSQLVATFALGFGIFILAWHPGAMIVGFWLVGVGWLAIRTARSELMRSNLIERASRVRASDAIMGLNPTIRARATLDEAVDILLEQRENGPGLVRDRDRFVGMITLEQARQTPRINWSSKQVGDVMIPLDTLPDTPPDAPLLDVLRKQFRCAPNPVIVRGGNGDVIGLIRHDMAPRLLLRRAEERGIEFRRTTSADKPVDRS